MSGILFSKYLFWEEYIVQNIANIVRIEFCFSLLFWPYQIANWVDSKFIKLFFYGTE